MLAMLANVGTADDIVFNVPVGAEGVFVEDDGIVGNGVSLIRSGSGSFDPTPFAHPAGSLTINAPSLNAVSIQFSDSLGAADFTVNVGSVPPIFIGSVHTSGTVALTTQGSIFEVGADAQPDIVASDLILRGGDGIGVNNPLETSVDRVEAVTDSGGIFLREANGIQVGGVSGTLNGLSVRDSGSISIVLTAGSISLAEAEGLVSAGSDSGDVHLTALAITAAISTSAGVDISAPQGNVVLTADRMEIAAGSEVLAGATALLKPQSAGRPIILGSSIDGSAALELSDAELDRITTSVLRIGSAVSGDILLTDAISPAQADYLSLHTGGAIVDGTPTEDPAIRAARGLALRAGAGIGASDDLDVLITSRRLAFENAAGAVNIASIGQLTTVALDGLATSSNRGTTTSITAEGMLFEVDVTTRQDTTFTAAGPNPTSIRAGIGTTVDVTNGSLAIFGPTAVLLGATLRAAGAINISGSTGIAGTVDAGVGVPLANSSVQVSFNEGFDRNGILRGANLPDGLRVESARGDSYVTVTDKQSSAAHSWTVSDSLITRDDTSISLGGVVKVFIIGGNGPDAFELTASPSTQFDIFGHLPLRDAPTGDSLDIDFTGSNIIQAANFTDTSHGYGGTFLFDNRKHITFTSIEDLSPNVDLQVSTTDAPSTTAPGSTLTYELDYGNAGMLWADGVVLTEVLPLGTAFDAALSTSGWTETEPGSGVFRLVVGRLEGGETGSAVFAVTVNDPLPAGQNEITNVAIIVDEGGLHDPMPEDNWSTTITEVEYPGVAYAVAADAGGGPHVRAFSAGGQERFSFFAYAAHFTGGVRVAMGDVTNDGTPDIITAAGPGGGPHVRVFDGETGQEVPGAIGSFFAYDFSFTGGVFLASADFNDDGHADIVTATGAGGSRQVRVFSGVDGSVLLNAVEDPKFEGELRVATGDITGDGTPDIITAIGAGSFEAEVHVFDGTSGQPIAGNPASLVAYPGFFGGAYVASGDVDGDGRDDIITGAGAGGGPHVKAFSGVDGSLLASFFAYSAEFAGGVRVATSDLGDDGRIEILTAAGPGGGPHVRAFALDGLAEVTNFFAFGSSFAGGVFVAGAVAPAVDSVEATVSSGNMSDSGTSEQAMALEQTSSGLVPLQLPPLDAELVSLEADNVDDLFTATGEDPWSLPDEPLLGDTAATDSTDAFWEQLSEIGTVG